MIDFYRGSVYALSDELGASAVAVLVISEDDWNYAMHDVVAVPIYSVGLDDEEQLLRPRVGDYLADCTRIGSFHEDDLADFMFDAEQSEIDATAFGVRTFLDIDTMLSPPKFTPPPSISRRDWWPNRGGVYYGRSFNGQREIYGVITSDEWNVRNDYSACVFLTSVNKKWRSRWQIPISSSGYAIICDVDIFRHGEFDHRAKTKVLRLTRDDLTAVAQGLVVSLEL
ncbi:MAG: hypothetical protein ACPGYP_04930 [Solirubrobacterales bacterium]